MTRDYAVYLPADSKADPWGVRLTAAGHTRIAAGGPYPPGRHPADHALNWTQGRVLNAYQLVYITAGRGRFESAASGTARIEAGTVFLLFPGVWHRYEPGRGEGWTEDWMELRGPALDRLRRAGAIRPAKPIFRPGLDPALGELFAECHRLAVATPKGYQSVLGLLGLQFLARIANAPKRPSPGNGISRSVNLVRSRIAESAQDRLSMPDLADDLGVSYSYLRRAFKAHTGVTLKQYHIQVRLRRAQEHLLDPQLSVKEIAARLGFDSPFHFSADFKRHTGLPPKQWRTRHGVDRRRVL